MATQASRAKRRAREMEAINKKLDDILSILDAGENPPEEVAKQKQKTRTRAKKA